MPKETKRFGLSQLYSWSVDSTIIRWILMSRIMSWVGWRGYRLYQAQCAIALDDVWGDCGGQISVDAEANSTSGSCQYPP